MPGREGGHYRVTLVADAFRGRSALERHRLVYAAPEPLSHGVHALNISAWAPRLRRNRRSGGHPFHVITLQFCNT
jgi:stress-induced morphogen